jgi:hypothetical protein
VGRRAGLGVSRREIFLAPAGCRTTDRPARNLFPIPSAVSRLLAPIFRTVSNLITFSGCLLTAVLT